MSSIYVEQLALDCVRLVSVEADRALESRVAKRGSGYARLELACGDRHQVLGDNVRGSFLPNHVTLTIDGAILSMP